MMWRLNNIILFVIITIVWLALSYTEPFDVKSSTWLQFLGAILIALSITKHVNYDRHKKEILLSFINRMEENILYIYDSMNEASQLASNDENQATEKIRYSILPIASLITKNSSFLKNNKNNFSQINESLESFDKCFKDYREEIAAIAEKPRKNLRLFFIHHSKCQDELWKIKLSVFS